MVPEKVYGIMELEVKLRVKPELPMITVMPGLWAIRRN